MCEHYLHLMLIPKNPTLFRIYERFLSFGKLEIIMLVNMSAQRFALISKLSAKVHKIFEICKKITQKLVYVREIL